jgi:hypothetical protein
MNLAFEARDPDVVLANIQDIEAKQYIHKAKDLRILGYYMIDEKKYEEAVKYFECAGKRGDAESVYMYTMLMNEQFFVKEKETIKGYERSLLMGCPRAISKLLSYVETGYKYKRIARYIRMGMAHNKANDNANIVVGLAQCYNDYKPIVIYYLIHLTKNEKFPVPDLITKDRDVVQFKGKIRNYVKDETCTICLNEKKCIPYNCMEHHGCLDCYVKVMSKDRKCPLCRFVY